MSDLHELSGVSDTQVLYADAGFDPTTGKPRLLEITRILSMQKVFEVESVVPVTERRHHPGVAVLEFSFKISVGDYRQMVMEAAQGIYSFAATAFNVPMDKSIEAYTLEEAVEHTGTSGVKNRRSGEKVTERKRLSVNQVGDNGESGAEGDDKQELLRV